MRRLLAAVLLLSGCASMQVRSHAPDSDGARGWKAWLGGDSATAGRAFDTAKDDDAQALYGRALMAHERGDWDHSWDRWWAVLEGATHHARDPWWSAFADAAAHKLEQLVGEVPGERAQADKLALLDGG